MGLVNYRSGDREPEALVVVPDVLVFATSCPCGECFDRPLPRVSEAIEPISTNSERTITRIDTWVVDAAQRTIATIPSIKRIG